MFCRLLPNACKFLLAWQCYMGSHVYSSFIYYLVTLGSSISRTPGPPIAPTICQMYHLYTEFYLKLMENDR